jgi:uncharacterized protein Veg
MKNGPTFVIDTEEFKKKLNEKMNQNITVCEHKTKNKSLTLTGKLIMVTDRLFMFRVRLGRDNYADYSYTYTEIETGKVEFINKEE